MDIRGPVTDARRPAPAMHDFCACPGKLCTRPGPTGVYPLHERVGQISG
ncbi:hypothetical protein [Stutzerimonas xanthomarina]